MIKVFLSHQQADAITASQIERRLRIHHSIESYLDVIDPYLLQDGEDLAAYIREKMGACTQLLAVVSNATRGSQWVPWEIGVATEKKFPLATFSAGGVAPPEFLQKWPYLTTDFDIDRYAMASKSANITFASKRMRLAESIAREQATTDFFSILRSSLGQ